MIDFNDIKVVREVDDTIERVLELYLHPQDYGWAFELKVDLRDAVFAKLAKLEGEKDGQRGEED